MRIVFMGTPPFAVPALTALMAAGHDVVAAYTQPPRPGGRRGRDLTDSAVSQQATRHGIPVHCPKTLRAADAQATFAALDADVAVVAAYGLLLPQAILDAPRLGCVNIHASLLPRWRGAAPIQRAILAGDIQTGVTIMQMEAGLDTGPMRLISSIEIGTDSVDRLTDRLAALGAAAICTVLADPDAYPGKRQDDATATYAPKIAKSEARIDFTQPAASVARQVQAFSPWPGAFCELAGERLKLHHALPLDRSTQDRSVPGTLIDLIDADTGWPKPDRRGQAFVIACGDGYLLPQLVQRPGKTWLDAADFLNGVPHAIGGVAT